jgi:hypothetical protein
MLPPVALPPTPLLGAFPDDDGMQEMSDITAAAVQAALRDFTVFDMVSLAKVI